MDGLRAALQGAPMFADLDVGDLARSAVWIGGVSNRSYRVEARGQSWVVRVPGEVTRRLIDRAAEAHNAARVAPLGWTIADAWRDPSTGVKVARFVPGVAALGEAEARTPEGLMEIAGALRRLHDSGVEFEPAFSPRDALPRCARAIASCGHEVPAPLGAAEDDFRRCVELLDGDGAPARPAPCHQDAWRENFLRAGDRLLLIDWEHSGPGDPIYDLADFAAQNELPAEGEEVLLRAYYGRAPSPVERARFGLSKALGRFVWGAWAMARGLVGGAGGEVVAAGAHKLAQARALLQAARSAPSLQSGTLTLRTSGSGE